MADRQERISRRKSHRRLSHLRGMEGRVESFGSGMIRALVIAFFVILQFAIIIAIPILLGNFAFLFIFLMEICSIAGILILMNDNRSMAYKFGWLSIIAVLPIAGIIMFFMFGRVGKHNSINRRIAARFYEADEGLVFNPEIPKMFRKDHPVSSRISSYMEAEGSPLYKNTEVKYFEMGELALDDIFEKLEQAKRFIFLEFFIVAEGAIWDKLHELLLRKKAEGVEVKFMFDDFGALMRTPTSFASRLRAEGLDVVVFNPLGRYVSKLYMNFRTHQKIVVIDGEWAYTGGFNIADEYANLVERFGVWKDAGVCLRGEAVWGMTIAFLEMWNASVPGFEIDFDRYKPDYPMPENDTFCHVLRDGPGLGPRSFFENAYKQMIQFSERKLYVTTPYLILEESMIDSLINARKRGVDVRIITPNIPDKKRIKMMTEYNYGVLLKNGIRIYEYTPGFIHTKVIINEHSAIAGTVNMDYRSFYLHYENGVWVYDREFVSAVEQDIIETIGVSHEVLLSEWKARPLRRKISQYILKVFDSLV